VNTGATITPRGAIVEKLDRLIRARYPIIAVNTAEERRFKVLMDEVLQIPTPGAAPGEPGRHFAKGLYYASRVSGLRQIAGPNVPLEGRSIPDREEPSALLDFIAEQDRGIFILLDYAAYFAGTDGQEDALLVRQLRELAMTIKPKGATIIFCGAQFPAIPSLEKEMIVYDLPLPADDEIAATLRHHLAKYEGNPRATIAVDEEIFHKLVEGLLGLTITEAEYTLDEATIVHRGLGPDALGTLLEKKRDLVARSGTLTYIPPQPVTHLGGYANLRALAEMAARAMTAEARAFGIKPLKGFLLVGLPGCGKDHFLTVLSSMLGRALLRCDMGSVIGGANGTLGSSLTEIKRAIAIAEVCNAILAFSEFEKAVGGLASSNRTDGGEVARTIAWLLNWMNDQERIFVCATANDISQLAPEQIRQGRFGTTVFVDLPSAPDRAEIFAVHLTLAGRDPAAFDLTALAEVADGFSGAEIQATVQAALNNAFFAGAPDITTVHLVSAIRGLRPLSQVKAEEIAALRKWAADHVATPLAAPVAADGAHLAEL
jgi:hypothetical protein